MITQLKLLAQEALQKREQHTKALEAAVAGSGLSRPTQPFESTPTARACGKALEGWRTHRKSQRRTLRKLESDMLKGMLFSLIKRPFVDVLLAATRKEEVVRFNKIKTDNNFAKMLKMRTLGPEHLEAQTYLRRNIRVCPLLLQIIRTITYSASGRA